MPIVAGGLQLVGSSIDLLVETASIDGSSAVFAALRIHSRTVAFDIGFAAMGDDHAPRYAPIFAFSFR